MLLLVRRHLARSFSAVQSLRLFGIFCQIRFSISTQQRTLIANQVGGFKCSFPVRLTTTILKTVVLLSVSID